MRRIVGVVIVALTGLLGASASAQENPPGHERACQSAVVHDQNKHCSEEQLQDADGGQDDPTPIEDRAPRDTDGDSLPDSQDRDTDGDGVPDWLDNCPRQFNDDQANADAAEEGVEPRGDACDGDNDNDGVRDGADNCDVDANAKQEDTDHDGIGDACDPDRDNDGVPNSQDNCELVSNRDQADADHDRTGDACDDSGSKSIGDQVSEAARFVSRAALDQVDAVAAHLP